MTEPTSIGCTQPLDRAWQRMRLILFSPFDLGKWIVLGFSAWLANLMGGFGGGGLNGNFKGSSMENLHDVLQSSEDSVASLLQHWFWIPLVVLALLLAAGFLVLLLWLSSRAKFIFLDNVVHDRAVIAEPWRRYRDLGNSLFLWRLGFGVVVFAWIAVLLGGTIGLSFLLGFGSHGGLLAGFPFIVFLLLTVASIIPLVYVSIYLESFIVPIMYGFDLKATEAWRVFLEWWKRHTGPFIVYGLFVIGLSILVGIGIIVVGFATCCIGFFLLVLPYVGTVLTLPIWVTYRALGVEFLAQLDPRFDLFAAALAKAEGEPVPAEGPVAPSVPEGDPPAEG